MSLMDKILSLNTTRPTESELVAPRTYKRRATWIPVEGEKVTAWRISSYDPDRQLEFAGVYISGDDDSYRVRIVGEETVCTFNKRDGYGGTLWFLDHRGTQNELEMNK
jgi:hypothetical protein